MWIGQGHTLAQGAAYFKNDTQAVRKLHNNYKGYTRTALPDNSSHEALEDNVDLFDIHCAACDNDERLGNLFLAIQTTHDDTTRFLDAIFFIHGWHFAFCSIGFLVLTQTMDEWMGGWLLPRACNALLALPFHCSNTATAAFCSTGTACFGFVFNTRGL